MDAALIANSELAREAGVSEKTIINMRKGHHSARPQTKRAVLEALNRLFTKAGKRPVTAAIFESKRKR